MSYSREVYDKVEKKLYNIRIKAIEELEKKKKIFYIRFPRAREIETSLASISIEAAKVVIRGGDVKKTLLYLKKKSKDLRNELDSLLASANLPKDFLEIKYSCKICKDEGFKDGKMCECMKNFLKSETYKKLNEMSPIGKSCFENFSLNYYSQYCLSSADQSPRDRMEQILEFCKNYSKEFSKSSPGLLMTGNTGLGKTHLSLAIASEVIAKGYSVIYSSIQNIISAMEKERFRPGNTETCEEHHFIECDLLIIDDLGTEFSTAFSCSAIYGIINSRIMTNKPTIINTNLSMKELEKNYSSRIVSRLMGNNIRLEFLGSDIRQKLMIDHIKNHKK